ncbi:MAG: sugar phosphate isomerase/epimerase [Treponema sp.]|jgi:hexulose-6-phosphate isomerase|nr:sugar phosphate isomerase/epimerase [Treponema sp.]
MKAAFSLFSFPRDDNPAELFALIKKAGYEGVEPALSDTGYLNLSSSDDDIRALKKLAEKHGLSIPSVGAWNHWDYNLVSDNADTREKARSIIRFQLHAARLLGADTILVVPGYVSAEISSTREFVRYDTAYERALDAFRVLKNDAEREGVKIGIENVWNRFLLSPLETARFVDEVGSPCFGVYFDVGNIIYIGYPDQWIEILGKRIFKIHLSDYRFGQAGFGAFVDLFAGDVDFKAVVKSLKAIGYDDWLTTEMLPNYKQFPRTSIFSSKAAMDTILEMCNSIL